MKRNILFLQQDIRGQEPIFYNQVAKKTFKKYKLNELFDIKIKEYTESGKEIKTWVLGFITKIDKNIYYFDIVRGAEQC